MAARNGVAAEVANADAARAIERELQEVRQRIERGGVMEYLKPLGPGGRKDVNKQFLTSTIRSVDSHNRRQEEDKLWNIRELERKLDQRRRSHRGRSRSQSYSPDRRDRTRGKRRDQSCSRSRSRDRDRDRRHRDRSRSSGQDPCSRSPRRGEHEATADTTSAGNTSDAEREYWAVKKAEKTKKMWENVYAGTTSVLVTNAPEFSSEDDSGDSDERIHGTSDGDDKKQKKGSKDKKNDTKKKKKKKHKKEKKPKSSKTFAGRAGW